MMSLTFGLVNQVSGLGPLGRLVIYSWGLLSKERIFLGATVK